MIKAKISINREKSALSFPKLMEGECGSVVLFEKEQCGTMIVKGDNNRYEIGTHRTDWVMSWFIDFTGTITLSNEVNK